MVKIHRFIFRLDFNPIFQIIDSVGSNLDLFNKCAKDLGLEWQGLSVNRNRSLVIGKIQHDEIEYCNINLEPNSLGGELQLRDGKNIGEITDTKLFKLFKVITEDVTEKFVIQKFNRIGIRSWLILDAEESDFESLLRLFINKVNWFNEFNHEDEKIDDAGFVLESTLDDKQKIKFIFGPYQKSESKKYFPDIKDSIGNLGIISDIDIYEYDKEIIKFRLEKYSENQLKLMEQKILKLNGIIRGVQE